MQSLMVLLLLECPFCFLVVVLGLVSDEPDEPDNAEQLLPELTKPLAETGVFAKIEEDDA
jgi:hypothetical protein